MEEFKPIETQEELDAVIKKSVDEAVKQYENYVSKEDYDRKVEELQSQINYNDRYISQIDEENRGYKPKFPKSELPPNLAYRLKFPASSAAKPKMKSERTQKNSAVFLQSNRPHRLQTPKNRATTQLIRSCLIILKINTGGIYYVRN